MKADKELEDMDQSEIDAIFLEAFKKSSVLDQIKGNFDRAYIEEALAPEPDSGRRLLQPRVKLNNALESVALKITGQHMVTTINLGGPLEVNGTLYKNITENIEIQEAFRKQFVDKIMKITEQKDYSDEKVFGAKVNFGSKIVS